MYLFDTDTLSNLMKRSPSSRLLSRLRSTPLPAQFTSSITLGELIYGAERKGSPRLQAQIHQLVTANLPVLPFDAIAARRYGELRARLESRGTPIGDADMRIAAIALVHGFAVITANLRDFQRVPDLLVQNWI